MGYYLVYGFFYLVSLLPWFIIYGLSDIVAFILAYLVKYRRPMMQAALAKSFPEKSAAERRKILWQFYRNFSDTWFEMIKIMTMSTKQLSKMVDADMQAFHDMHKKNHAHVQVFLGHFMNWELYQSIVTQSQPYQFRGIYMALSNPLFEKIAYKIRTRFGSKLVSAKDPEAMNRELRPLPGTSFCTGVVADQSPPNLHKAYWMRFLNQPTAFLNGPWHRMAKLNQPVLYIRVEKKSRGRYRLYSDVMFEEPALMDPKEMMIEYVSRMEKTIRQSPEIYLWSHRRWKIPYNPANPGAEWIGPKLTESEKSV